MAQARKVQRGPMARNIAGVTMAVAAFLSSATADAAEERSELVELRNTVAGLLQSLVDRGVISRDQAQGMVQKAQDKATEQVTAEAAQEKSEEGAVRVTFVPQVVKDEITEQVRKDVRPLVVDDVIDKARSEGWGVPEALPEWSRRITLTGDVRVRSASAMYAADNIPGTYLDFQAINSSGGVGPAGINAVLNTTEDRYAMQGRLRFGARVRISDNADAFMQFTTGNLAVPVSTNQTAGNSFNRWTVGVDRAGIEWRFAPTPRQGLNLLGGRFENPFENAVNSELVWDQDVSFDGIAARYAYDFGDSRGNDAEPNLFLTAGAFPIDEVPDSGQDKWLYGAELGSKIRFGESGMFTASVAYFDYDNIEGIRNAPDSALTDYTAPAFLQKGNTLFDIRNDLDPTTNLFALASDYNIATAYVGVEFPMGGIMGRGWAEYVRNVGFDEDEIFERTGTRVDERADGYEIGFGVESSPDWRLHSRGWRAAAIYRYLERDAVLDAFTDSDFHLGGTDAQGWSMSFDYVFARKLWARLRYLSANEIDGPPLGIDVILLDLNAAF